jgi:hypothetical protein
LFGCFADNGLEAPLPAGAWFGRHAAARNEGYKSADPDLGALLQDQLKLCRLEEALIEHDADLGLGLAAGSLFNGSSYPFAQRVESYDELGSARV